jgi:hypothetical protein
MNIIAAFKYREHGYRIRRTEWIESYNILPNSMYRVRLSAKDILADDWEIVVDGIVSQFPITYSD